MTALPYSQYDNTKVLVPGSFSSSLGGNTYLYESKAGSKKRARTRNKRTRNKRTRNKKTRNKKTRNKRTRGPVRVRLHY